METTTKRTESNTGQILLWFGAAVSISEIMTGALIAPLGLSQGIFAIILGHIIGAAILLPAGLIGAKSGLSAAESARISFGKYGSYGFSVLNILQLIGWTAVMIVNGAKALDVITGELASYNNEILWCIVIGGLICFWIVVGIKNLSKINYVVCSILFIFSLILGYTVFTQQSTEYFTTDTITFAEAVELNVAMSLSWLPLISDYTRLLKKPVSGTIGSVLGYSFGSLLMFIIGLGAAIYAGTSEVTTILLSAGMGAIALIIVVFSTVTTTFLDVYSAGVSAANFSKKINEKAAAIIMCIIGTVLAITVQISQYENFLYLIGSVFAPIFAILFVDFYIFGKNNIATEINIKNIIMWLVGFVIYRFLMSYSFFIGTTLPVMLIIGIICFVVNKFSSNYSKTI